MKRPRVTIGGLLTLVLFLAIGLAALKAANPYWDSALLGLTLALLAASALLAIHGRGARRAFWLGFMLVGSGYFWASREPTLVPRLPTTLALSSAFNAMLAGKLAGQATVWTTTVSNGVNDTIKFSSLSTKPQPASFKTYIEADNIVVYRNSSASSPTWESFTSIGNSLFALLFAAIGGYASRTIHFREASALLVANQSDRETSADSLRVPE
jgi:hypothetical protein